MRIFVYIWIALLTIASCSEKKVPAPADLLSVERFADILRDVRLLEGAYATKYNRVDSSQYKIGAYYERLFADHSITKEQYMSSYSYYMNDPKKMMAIEDLILTKVTAMQVEQDSLNRINHLNMTDTLVVDSVKIDSTKKAPVLEIKRKNS
ncbi:MAG: DUF4296 domain-containing protein [Flavobacteriales bacterium]|nr:DUF4296 domain-containing protein [Flavobacteriales bacterium]